MHIPPINARGTFTFQDPFKTLLKEDIVYTVLAIRSLTDLYESNEDPYTYIYKQNNIPEAQFDKDLVNRMPIVTLTTNGSDFYYVPVSYIMSTPTLTGYTYQEYVVGINLGLLPQDPNVEATLNNLKTEVRDTLGRDVTVELIPSSAPIMLDQTENKKALDLLNNAKKEYKSYKTKYQEAMQLIANKDAIIAELEAELAKYI